MNNIVDNKEIMNILRIGTITNGSFNDRMNYYNIEIKTSSNFLIQFYLTIHQDNQVSRGFNICKEINNNYPQTLYAGKISKEDYIEFDYLVINRTREFIKNQIDKMLTANESNL